MSAGQRPGCPTFAKLRWEEKVMLFTDFAAAENLIPPFAKRKDAKDGAPGRLTLPCQSKMRPQAASPVGDTLSN